MPDSIVPMKRTEAKFLGLYVKSFDMQKVSKQMGMTVQGCYLIRKKPHVEKAIREYELGKISDAHGLATTKVFERLQDPKVSDRFLMDAWRELRRGMEAHGVTGKELHEMTIEELNTATQQARDMLASMTDISPGQVIEGDVVADDSDGVFD